MPPTARRDIVEFLKRSKYGALFSLAIGATAIAPNWSELVLAAGAILVVGIACAGLHILSWRRNYPPMLTWLIFELPSAFLILGAFNLVLWVPLSQGAISVLGGVGALVGCGGFGYFGALFLLRHRLIGWLDA